MWDRWWEWALRPRMMVLMTVLLLVSAHGHLTNNTFLQMYDPGWGVLLLAGIPLLFGGWSPASRWAKCSRRRK